MSRFVAVKSQDNSRETIPPGCLPVFNSSILWLLAAWLLTSSVPLHEFSTGSANGTASVTPPNGGGDPDVSPIISPVPVRAGGMIRLTSIAGGSPGTNPPGVQNSVCKCCTRSCAALPTLWPLVEKIRAQCSGIHS